VTRTLAVLLAAKQPIGAHRVVGLVLLVTGVVPVVRK
jgi:hypothetical protein